MSDCTHSEQNAARKIDRHAHADDHTNNHSHGDQHGHSHGHSHGAANRTALAIAAALTGCFMIIEVIGGILSGSLALLADAGHMLSDFASLVLAWLAARLALRPADWKRTYGFDRLSVLAAFVNGLTLFAIAVFISIEAIKRLADPQPVLAGPMLWVAVAGLIVNILAFWVLSRGDGANLNVRAAALHVAGDLLGSVAAIVAALVIMATGWMPIDPLLSIFVVLIILRAAWSIVMESGHILLEGAPRGFDSARLVADLTATVEGVVRIHHVHAWSISEERPMLTLEADIEPGRDPAAIKAAIRERVSGTTGITHATIEINVIAQGA